MIIHANVGQNIKLTYMSKLVIFLNFLLFIYIKSFGQSEYKTYRNDKYGISFEYPKNYNIEEHFDYLVASNIDTMGCAIEFSIKIFDPARRKVAYDCCYTPEEIEKYGIIPSIEIWFRRHDCLKYKYEVSPNVKNVINKLDELGIDTVQIIKSTIFIPRGRTRDLRVDSRTGKRIDEWILVDRCDTCQVFKENELIIKCTSCPEGVVENSQANIVCDGEYSIQIEDFATEYPRAFDDLIKSIIIIKPTKLVDTSNESNFIGFRKYGVASDETLFKEQLTNFSKQELRIIRNEIMASHGYIFETKDLKEYFEHKDWYKPEIVDINTIVLSDIEKKNVELLLELENEK
jgi:hypothetical protein